MFKRQGVDAMNKEQPQPQPPQPPVLPDPCPQTQSGQHDWLRITLGWVCRACYLVVAEV